jgi:hypothetical protein
VHVPPVAAWHPIVVHHPCRVEAEQHPVLPRLLVHAAVGRFEVFFFFPMVMRRRAVVVVGVEVEVVWAMTGTMSITF